MAWTVRSKSPWVWARWTAGVRIVSPAEMTRRALAAKGPILKNSPALPLELHHVVHRPGQLAEEVLAVRFIAQDEIRIVPHQAPFVPEDVWPRLKGVHRTILPRGSPSGASDPR